jgi:hypothetical protein
VAEDRGAKRLENGSMDPYARFHPMFILPCRRQPIGRGAPHTQAPTGGPRTRSSVGAGR